MALMGKEGLPNIAEICLQNSQYAANEINKLSNFNLMYDNSNFLKEFVVKTKFSVKKLVEFAAKNGFNISPLKNDSTDSLLLLAFTEKYKKSDIDDFVSFLKDYNV